MLTSAQFIRLPQVKEITSLSKSSIYRLMEDGDFPKQVVLGVDLLSGLVRSKIGVLKRLLLLLRVVNS